jgi:hypothetical protein
MKSSVVVSLAFLAAAASYTDAFGAGQGMNRISNRSHGSTTPFGNHGSVASISSSSSTSALKMASGNDQVIIDKDFRLSAIFLGAGLLLDQIPYIQLTLGPIVTLLGILFLVQTFRLDFVCDDSTFSLQDTTTEDNEVGENIVVGGENRWTYDSFANFDFFPEVRGLVD